MFRYPNVIEVNNSVSAGIVNDEHGTNKTDAGIHDTRCRYVTTTAVRSIRTAESFRIADPFRESRSSNKLNAGNAMIVLTAEAIQTCLIEIIDSIQSDAGPAAVGKVGSITWRQRQAIL